MGYFDLHKSTLLMATDPVFMGMEIHRYAEVYRMKTALLDAFFPYCVHNVVFYGLDEDSLQTIERFKGVTVFPPQLFCRRHQWCFCWRLV